MSTESRPSPISRRPKRRILAPVVLYLSMAILAIPFVYPLLWMVFSTFKPIAEIYGAANLWPNQWTTDALGKIFTVNPLLQQYWNSLYTSVLITAITVLLASMGGYAFARLRFPHANKVFFLVLSTIFLPVEVTSSSFLRPVILR